jgi:signal transduction histidine kinase/ActR/RegA family two-component response regulator
MSEEAGARGVVPPGQLERELAYYRRECNDLGARLLRLQEEQSQAFREARRSRTVAKLIREANRLADTGIAPDELGAPVLEIVVDNAMCDRAAFLSEDPAGSGRFQVTHAVGGGDRLSAARLLIRHPPTFFFTTAQTPLEPPASELTGILRLPYVLWAYDRASGQALIIGNRSEANVSRAFEAGDQELIEGGLSVYLDVLARKRAETQLREAKEAAEAAHRDAEEARAAAERAAGAKSSFLAAMSHEIRTPLTSVLGMADLLATEDLAERQNGYVEAIRASGRHLLTILNDILDFSRIEAERLELERIDFPLGGVLGELRSLVAPQAAERDLAVAFELDEGAPPMVRGDPTRLRQVLFNLIGNALKFTREGRISVAAQQAARDGRIVRLRFEVRDTGVGIPSERQAALFEPFSQHDASTTRRYGGTGLGLAICKRLVEAMGGAIGVESTTGAGSLFWFEVPLEIGDPTAAAAVTTRPAFDPGSTPPLRVLVAEDMRMNRELLRAMLGRQGHDVTFAEDGAEAVEWAERERFDLVLMDVRMPVMDGMEAARRIRRLPSPAGSVPILGLTANVMEAERRRCVEAGMDMILTKPVAWPELFALFADVAAGRGPNRR